MTSFWQGTRNIAILPEFWIRTSKVEKWHVSDKAHGITPFDQNFNFEFQNWKNTMFLTKQTWCRYLARILNSNLKSGKMTSFWQGTRNIVIWQFFIYFEPQKWKNCMPKTQRHTLEFVKFGGHADRVEYEENSRSTWFWLCTVSYYKNLFCQLYLFKNYFLGDPRWAKNRTLWHFQKNGGRGFYPIIFHTTWKSWSNS